MISLSPKAAQRVFDVTSYLATGNGTTDDSAAITAMFSAISSAGGGVAYFPEGTYLVSTEHDVPSNTIVRGAGANSIIKRRTGNYLVNVFRVASKTNVTFEDLQIDGNKADIIANYSTTALDASHIYTTCNGIYVTGGANRTSPSTNITINNCTIHDAYFGNIETDDVDGIIISNNTIYYGRDNQINARVNTYGYTRNAVVTGNLIYGAGLITTPDQYSGIQFLRGQYLTITGNTIHSLGNTSTFEGNGIGMEGCRHFTISGNTVHHNLIQGIKVDRTVEGDVMNWEAHETYLVDEYVYYLGNRFKALLDNVAQTPPSTATSDTYWSYSASFGGDQWSMDGTISNNIIANNNYYDDLACTTDGFFYQYSQKITFTGNTLYGNYHGIKNGPHVGEITFSNNIIQNSQQIGVMLYENTDQRAVPIFKNNSIVNNGDKGIDSVIPIIIDGNYVAENNGAGVAISVTGTPAVAKPFVKISNNTFADNADSGIVVNSGINSSVPVDIEFNYAPPSDIQPRGLGENGSAVTARFNRFKNQDTEEYYLTDADSVWIDEDSFVKKTVFNVTTYGAVGDGTTDDLTAIQAAINAAQTDGGGIVFFPRGTYIVSGSPTITGSNVIIDGTGDGSKILLASTALNSSGTTIGMWVNGGSNVTIQNINIDGNFANVAKDGAFILPSSMDSQATLAGSLGSGANATVTLSGTLTGLPTTFRFIIQIDSEMIIATRSGTTLTAVVRGVNGTTAATHAASAAVRQSTGSIGGTNSTLYDAIITEYGATTMKNYIMGGAGSIDASTYLHQRLPIRITDANNVMVRNCLIEESVSAGVLADGSSVDSCKDIIITNNRIRKTWDNGIYFHQGVKYGMAVNNDISDTMYNGVSAVYCDRIMVNDNTIRKAGPSPSDSGGIQINGSSNCSVVGNMIDSCQFYGIDALSTQETNITGGKGGLSVWTTNLTVNANTITNCHSADYPTHSAPGINLFGVDNAAITNNSVNDCDFGISAGSRATNIAIISNRVTNNDWLGINVGNSADLLNISVKSNYIAFNGSHGCYNYAPVRYENNTIIGNNGMGIHLADTPTGVPYKVDYITGNTITDNTDSGMVINGGANSMAIVERNTFANSIGTMFYDGVVTSGSTGLVSQDANFTADDVGLTVTLINQGADDIMDTRTIASVTDEHTVVLSGNASATQTGLQFSINRGPAFFIGSITGDTLTAASGTFRSTDDGNYIQIYSNDPSPVLLFAGTLDGYTSSTTVSTNGTVGTYTNVRCFLDRSAGQQARAVNNYNDNPVMMKDNTVVGMPEYLGGGGTINVLHPPLPSISVGTATPTNPGTNGLWVDTN